MEWFELLAGGIAITAHLYAFALLVAGRVLASPEAEQPPHPFAGENEK
jgi:hypothetical protein